MVRPIAKSGIKPNPRTEVVPIKLVNTAAISVCIHRQAYQYLNATFEKIIHSSDEKHKSSVKINHSLILLIKNFTNKIFIDISYAQCE